MRTLVRSMLGAAALLAWHTTGSAQTPVADALECFKVTARTAAADVPLTLDPLRPDFLGSQCTVRARMRYVCTPVARTPSPATPSAPLTTDFTCYKLRCQVTARPADRTVSDGSARTYRRRTT